MVQFNSIAIDPKYNTLRIDVSVVSKIYYVNVKIKRLYIDTQDTYVSGGPSSKAYVKELTDAAKSFVWILTPTNEDINHRYLPSLKDNLFFIYVETEGAPSPGTPCGQDNTITLATVFDRCPIYNMLIQYVKSTLDECSIPKELIDKYLLLKALELSANTQHYPEAINYYRKLTSNTPSIPTKTCNCHG